MIDFKIFKKNKLKTEKMKKYFFEKTHLDDYVFIGVYEYKNYQIFYDKYPLKNKLLKHISISSNTFEKIDEKDLELIANNFIGENYTVGYGILVKNVINVWENYTEIKE